jgi:hypothetical protein
MRCKQLDFLTSKNCSPAFTLAANLIKFMKSAAWFILLLCTCLFISCDEEKMHTPIAVTEVAENLRLEFHHLEKDLFAADFKNSNQVSQDLYQKYGAFWCGYVEEDLAIAACQSDSVQKLLYPFVVNTTMLAAHDAIQKGYTSADFEDMENQLSDAMRKWASLYPSKPVPKIVYYQSGWTNNIRPMDQYLGIALDSYLGPDHQLIKTLSTEFIPSYKKLDMRKDYIVPDAVKGWVAYQHQNYYQAKDLLHELVFYGKLMHITRSLLPETPDSLLLNWSSAELQWAQDNEWNTWKELAREERLFDKKMAEINKWFAQGPFTGARGLPQESSSQLGIWLGWQMVGQYMQAHPEVTIEQLMAEQDDLKILAAYKPKRS